MSMRYKGGVISATAPVTTTSKGVWTLTQQMQAAGSSVWPTVPGAPTIGTATGGNASASVTFTAPVYAGYPATITSYTVTSSPGGLTGTGASSPITVSGLTNGTAYTFTVTATNSTGTGPASGASNSVTPAVPVPTLVSSQTATHTAATSITITAPTSISSGSLLVAFIVHSDTEVVQTFTSIPSGWTTVSFSGSNNASLMMYYKTATGSEPASYTWSGATVSRQGTGVIYNYANASFDASSFPYRYQVSPTMTLTPVPSSLTVSANNAVVFFAAGSEDSGKSISAPAGYSTSISNLGGASQGGSLWVFFKTGVSAGSTGTPTTTLNSTGQGYVLLAVIK